MSGALAALKSIRMWYSGTLECATAVTFSLTVVALGGKRQRDALERMCICEERSLVQCDNGSSDDDDCNGKR